MIKKICIVLCSLIVLSGCGISGTADQTDIINSKYQSIREQRENSDTNTEVQADSTQSTSTDNKESIVKVGFCQVGSESGWREAHTNSMKEIFTEENFYSLDFVNGEGDQAKQIEAIRKFISEGVNVIVLDPVVEEGWDEVLNEAKNAGIPVIIVDRMIKTDDESLYECWVGSDFKAEGINAIEWLTDYMKAQGRENDNVKVVMLQGTLGASAEVGRTEGIREGISALSNYEIVYEGNGDFTKDKGKTAMEEYLKTNTDFDVLISQNDDMTFGAIEALKEAGLNPGTDVVVISFDGVKDAFQAMVDGEINAEIECNPLQGPLVAELVQKILANEDIEKVQYMYESVYDSSVAANEIGNRVY